MSFKLLAIRPLEGTDPSLLKGLKPNCIYRFYNEYDYLYDYDESTGEGKSFIDYQDQYFKEVSNKEDDYLKLEKKEIIAIKYNKQLPDGFFGKNINVSAVVGENGSGKSSLLELFYYCVNVLLNEVSYSKLFNVELFIKNGSDLYNYSFWSEEHSDKDMDGYYELNINGCECETIFKKSTDTMFVYNNKSTNCPINEMNFKTHVLNYSLYGLNSKNMPWISNIFYKKNLLDSPLIIHPFREEGCINVNYDNRLAQARLLQYIYGFEQTVLLDNISILEYNVMIDYENILSSEKNNIIEIYSNVNGKLNNGDQNVLFIHSVLELFGNKIEEQKCVDIAMELNSIFLGYQDREFDGVYLYYVENFEKKTSIIVQSLCFFYVVRLLYKLITIESEYSEYRFLFSKKVFRYSMDESFSITEIEKAKIKVMFDNNSGLLSLEIFTYITNVCLQSFKVTDIERLFQNGDEYINGVLFTKYFLSLYTEFTPKKLNLEDLLKSIMERFYKEYNDENNSFYLWAFYNLLKEINENNKDTMIELKSVIHYFSTDLFESIEPVKYHVNNPKQLEVRINSEYFINTKNIEDIPIYFFKYDINVVKTNVRDKTEIDKLIINKILVPYPYNSLSSGEQQIINSIVQICGYIIDYQKSKNKSKKIECYNLVFDELEVYLHPEFQRRYLSNLITVLKVLSMTNGFGNNVEQIYFNILLSTHSPFILSDIPSQNVLKLKDGKPEAGDNINSFGANIHDLLADEFFLDKGFMGEFAKEKISSVVDFLTVALLEGKEKMSKEEEEKVKKIKSKESYVEYTNEICRLVINTIGEPMLRYNIEELYQQFLLINDNKEDSVKKEIARLEAKIQELRRKGEGEK